MATASLIKANNPFLVTCKPSILYRPPFHQTLPNNLCFNKPTKFISLHSSNSTKHKHQVVSPFKAINDKLESKEESYSTCFYIAILQTLKALKSPVLSFVWMGLLSMMLLYGPNPALAASGGSMGGYSSSSGSSSYSSSSGGYESFNESNEKEDMNPIGYFVLIVSICILLCIIYACWYVYWAPEPQASFLKLQVGLLGTKQSLQKTLNRIAETADTSTTNGWICILKQTTMSLLQRFDYFVSGYFFWIGHGVLNMIDFRITTKPYVFIKFLVIAIGVYKLPAINSNGDLKEALHMLNSLPMSRIQGVLVLWTPQSENDALSEQELFQKYSILKPLNL